MSLRDRLVITLFVGVGLVIPTVARSWQDNESDKSRVVTMYVVVGPSKLHPQEKDRPWSSYYETRDDAEQRKQEIIRDHSAGYLLASDPDGPLELRIVPVKVRIFPPSTRESRPNDTPPPSRAGATPKAPSFDDILKDKLKRDQLNNDGLRLTRAKEILDKEKARLDQERAALITEGRSLRAKEAEIKALKRRAKRRRPSHREATISFTSSRSITGE